MTDNDEPLELRLAKAYREEGDRLRKAAEQDRAGAAEGEGPRVICEFSDYAELLAGLRLRAAELNLSGEQIDHVSGLPARYTQKLLGPHQIRRLGVISLGPFLGALAVRGVLLEDKAAVEKLRRQTTPRNQSYVRDAPSIVLTVRFFKKIGRKGAQARVENSTKEQRQEWARKAAIARWQKATS
jgi:hypothetical protein